MKACNGLICFWYVRVCMCVNACNGLIHVSCVCVCVCVCKLVMD